MTELWTGPASGDRRKGSALTSAEVGAGTPVRPRFLALPMVALLLPLVAGAIGGWKTWQDVLADSTADIAQTADGGAEYTSRALAGYVSGLEHFNETLQGLSDEDIHAEEARIRDLFRQALVDLPLAITGYVVDRNGAPLASATVYPVPRDEPVAAERDFFLDLAADAVPRVHISEMHVSRFDGKPFFAISERRQRPGNGRPAAAFDGLVNISIATDALAAGLGRLRSNSNDTMILVRDDGRPLTTPLAGQDPFPALAPTKALQGKAGRLVAKDLFSADPENGKRRLVAMRQVVGFPVYVVVSRERSAIVAEWWRLLSQHLIFGVPATLALFGLSMTVRSGWLRLHERNLSLHGALIESSANLRRVQAVGGVLTFEVAPDGTISCNDSFRDLLEFQPGQLLDIQVLLQRLAPLDRGRVLAGMRLLARRGGSFDTEVAVMRPDGKPLWLMVVGEAVTVMSPMRIVGVVMDITERKQTEALNRGNETRLSDLVETLKLAAVFVYDLKGRITFWSDGCVTLFGWSQQEAVGRTAVSLLKSVPSASPLDIETALREQGEWIGDVTKYHKDGTEMTIAVHRVMRRDAQGLPVSILENCADVTGLRHASRALEQLNRQLETMVLEEVEKREAAQTRAAHGERIQALGQLAGGIAHDLNNVLQSVTSGASLLSRDAEKPERVRVLGQLMADAAGRGMSVTRRMLVFSRQADLRAEPIDPRGMLTDVNEVLAHTLGGHITCEIDAPPGLPALMADRGQLETALINLATNARDAMPNGGHIVFAAVAETFEIPFNNPSGLNPGDYIRLSVRDTGVGMDAATLRRVTEPFFTTKKTGGGTGLGLATVNGFAVQSRGALAIQSTPGSGTLVSIWLPLAPPTASRQAPATDDAHTAELASRILLVDDDDTVRELLAGELESAGFVVLRASRGQEALEVLDGGGTASIGPPVDVLVCDLSMPEMSGLDVIREARARWPKLPAILVTGYATDHAIDPEDGLEFALLRKPVTISELTKVIVKVRSHRRIAVPAG